MFYFFFFVRNLYAKEKIFNRYNAYHCTLQKFGNLNKIPYYEFYDLCIDGDIYIFLIAKNPGYKLSIKHKLIKVNKKCSCYVKKRKNINYIY